MSYVDQATFDQQRRWTQEAEAELKAARERISELEKALAKSNALVREWSNFDFDCPDEYNPEIHEEEEDGWALNQLYEKTAKHLKAYEDK